MTRTELPAQAANILRGVGSTATCSSTVVESLKLLLLPTGPTIRPKPTEVNAARPKAKKLPAPPTKVANARTKKQPEVTVHECVEENYDTIRPQERLMLATEIFNVTLKALTNAIRNPQVPGTPKSKRRSLARSSSSASFSSATPTRCPTPLQPISVNRIVQSPAKPGHFKRSSSGSLHDSSGVRAQAECARIGLACLRSVQAMDLFSARFAPLQLETGMSALIAKLLALGFDDLALKELRILRRRIEALASSGEGKAGKEVGKAKSKPREEEADPQKESLPALLKYTATSLSEPLLNLVTTSQIQTLKMLASRRHGPSIEAALEHLHLAVNYAPANLIERQIDLKEPKTRSIAAHQLEILAQTLMRMCPNPSKTADESTKTQPSISPQAALQLQSLASRIRLRWWILSGHQPNIEKEMIDPFSRFLGAFQRRCRLESNAKYAMAKDAYEMVSTGLRSMSDTRVHSFTALLKILTDLASESRRNEEATQWVKAGLANSEDFGGSPSQRCVLLCQLTTLHLRMSREGADDKALLGSLKSAVGGLEGDLRGESAELDELLVAVASLRKAAFSIVQDRCKTFDPSEVLCDTSVFGQCVQAILVSIQFLARYIGKAPPQDASESKVTRYNERTKLASHVAPPMIESLVAIARLSVRGESSVWRSFDLGLRDCAELVTSLENASPGIREAQKATSRSLPLHVSISQAYWFRYLALKSTVAEAKVLVPCLRTSIDLLSHQTDSEKTAGSLLMKLEKYALLCETMHDYQRALQTYEEVIKFSIDAGVVQRIADASAAALSPAALTGDRDFEQLSRTLSSYPKAASRANRNGVGAKIFFDATWLPPGQRGWLLEQQLTSMIAILLNRGPSSVSSDDLYTLTTALLSTYKKVIFPIRRLRISVRVLQLLSVRSTVLESSLVRTIVDELGQQPLIAAGCLDEHLQHFTTHLVSSRDAYILLRSDVLDYHLLETILANWCALVQQCPDWASLQKAVYDISGWLQQLELIADFLKVKGKESLRTSVLHLLVAIHEGAASTQCLDLVSKLTDLGIHYARLGYSGHGGVMLQKAQSYLDVSDVPSQLQVKWYLTKADYSLINGDLDRT